jgi:hypothetical protein
LARAGTVVGVGATWSDWSASVCLALGALWVWWTGRTAHWTRPVREGWGWLWGVAWALRQVGWLTAVLVVSHATFAGGTGSDWAVVASVGLVGVLAGAWAGASGGMRLRRAGMVVLVPLGAAVGVASLTSVGGWQALVSRARHSSTAYRTGLTPTFLSLFSSAEHSLAPDYAGDRELGTASQGAGGIFWGVAMVLGVGLTDAAALVDPWSVQQLRRAASPSSAALGLALAAVLRALWPWMWTLAGVVCRLHHPITMHCSRDGGPCSDASLTLSLVARSLLFPGALGLLTAGVLATLSAPLADALVHFAPPTFSFPSRLARLALLLLLVAALALLAPFARTQPTTLRDSALLAAVALFAFAPILLLPLPKPRAAHGAVLPAFLLFLVALALLLLAGPPNTSTVHAVAPGAPGPEEPLLLSLIAGVGRLLFATSAAALVAALTALIANSLCSSNSADQVENSYTSLRRPDAADTADVADTADTADASDWSAKPLPWTQDAENRAGAFAAAIAALALTTTFTTILVLA